MVNEHCVKMSKQGNVMSKDVLQAYAEIRGASVKVFVLIFMHTSWFVFLTPFGFSIGNYNYMH